MLVNPINRVIAKKDPVVNLDDDNFASDESGDEEHDELGDKNGSAEVNASDDQYKRIIDLTTDGIWGLEFGSEEAASNLSSAFKLMAWLFLNPNPIMLDLGATENDVFKLMAWLVPNPNPIMLDFGATENVVQAANRG
ncbi:hypothetical protein RIF29_28803 [Crotalaria pallida]|uniref:Uncharacterized protein n=1 Tax=Crotalaria pallida TaxID=3830 RepID=A0AAN9EEA9_CROPI